MIFLREEFGSFWSKGMFLRNFIIVILLDLIINMGFFINYFKIFLDLIFIWFGVYGWVGRNCWCLVIVKEKKK